MTDDQDKSIKDVEDEIAQSKARAEALDKQIAQVTIDVAKITCDQYILFKVTDPRNIAIWMSGYYHGKRDNTLVDTQLLAATADKVKSFCLQKPQATVMQAVETVIGAPK